MAKRWDVQAFATTKKAKNRYSVDRRNVGSVRFSEDASDADILRALLNSGIARMNPSDAKFIKFDWLTSSSVNIEYKGRPIFQLVEHYEYSNNPQSDY